jgi:hypothetical protein
MRILAIEKDYNLQNLELPHENTTRNTGIYTHIYLHGCNVQLKTT